MISKRDVSIRFGAVRQDRGSKHMQTGDMLEARNVRQVKDGSFQKRRGLTSTVTAQSGASWTGNPESVLPGDGSALLARDSNDRHWAYDPDAATWRDAGRVQRCWPRSSVAIVTQAAAPRPVIVEVGNNLWTFGCGSGTYYRQVRDTTSGVQILAETSQAATGIVQLAAAYDGTYVWVFWVAAGTTVTAHRYSPGSPGTAPTVTTYQTIASTTLTNVEARRFSGISETAVVASGYNGSTSSITHSYLDPATGAARTSPAAVTSTYALGNDCTSTILVSNGSTTWYRATWRDDTLNLVAITSSTLAVASTVDLVSASNAVGALCGYVADNGDRVVFATVDTNTAANVRPDLHAVTRYTYNGSTTSTVIARASWLASQPVKYGSTWYLLVGFDDTGTAGATYPVQSSRVQRTLWLIDQDGSHVAMISPGECAAMYHQGDSPASAYVASHVPASFSSGTKLYFGIGTPADTGGMKDGLAQVSVLDVDMAAAFGKPVMLPGGLAVAPGSIPTAWGHRQQAHELGPMMFPNFITSVSGGAGFAFTGMAAIYRIVDSDGTIWRSAPLVGSQSGNGGSVWSVPSLRHALSGARVQIELYVGTTTLQLVAVSDNNAAADAVNITVPNVATMPPGETLYTTGGALSAAPVPACRAVTVWKNRLFIAVGNDVWTSQEIVPGFGPRFNEVQITSWPGTTGEITAFGAIDWNFLAVFRRDGMAVLSGLGPDGRGAGNFIAQSVPVRSGAADAGSVIGETPVGCLFRDAYTGRIFQIASDLIVRDVGQAWKDYDTETVLCAVHDSAEQHVLFCTANRIMVLDYGNPTETQSAGQGYTWSGTGILAFYAGCIDATGLVLMNDTYLRRPSGWTDDGEPVLVRMDLGHLQPAGLLGEWQCSEIAWLGTWTSYGDLQITTYPDFGTDGTSIRCSLARAPAQRSIRPAKCGRIHALRIVIEELQAVTGGSQGAETYADGEGFAFEGIRLTIQSQGRGRPLNSGQVL